ncbi:MAG: 23S rRNA pseudouridine(1911/1915/1917) synthase RluD [Gammaproteobacteria bacterium]
MSQRIQLTGEIQEESAGKRLDQVLAQLFPAYSRSRLQQWLKQGDVLLDGQHCKAKFKVQGGETVTVDTELAEEVEVKPQPIELDICHQDDSILIINKPAGLVVHPAAGNLDGTLQNALLYFDPALVTVPRSGIVHRLDKETSGLLVVARTLEAHHSLVQQLQERQMHREYLAVVHTVLTGGGTIEEPIGRHPRDRLKMAVVNDGKEAITHFRIDQRFRTHSLVRVQLETGRTHQIRVHMAHRHTPLVGDPTYGGRFRMPKKVTESLKLQLHLFRRQALHAIRLELTHPASREHCSWSCPVPDDMQALIDALQEDVAEYEGH